MIGATDGLVAEGERERAMPAPPSSRGVNSNEVRARFPHSHADEQSNWEPRAGVLDPETPDRGALRSRAPARPSCASERKSQWRGRLRELSHECQRHLRRRRLVIAAVLARRT